MAIGLGIGGIVMLGLAAAVSMTFSAKRNLDLKTESMIFTDRMARILAGTNSCARGFGLGASPLTLSPTPTVVTIDGVTEGNEVAPKLVVEELKMRENTAIAPVVAAGGVGFTRRAAYLSVKVRNEMDPTNFMSGRTRLIPFRVVTNPGGQIVSCSVESPEAQVCESMGGSWDAAAVQGEQCRPRGSCQNGGSFADANISPADGGYNNTMTGGRSCMPGFVPRVSGQLTFMQQSGKFAMRSVTYPTYTCMRCEDNTTLGGLGIGGAPALGGLDFESVFGDPSQMETNGDAQDAINNGNTSTLGGFP
ncbi:MAG: hypothetical protein V4760_09485 [Bdellovibrionota bacterium]